MIVKGKILAALLFSVVAIQSAWAQEAQEVTPQANSQEASPPEKSLQETADAAVAEAPSVPPDSVLILPKLNITWDCGDCEHNDKVPPLIEQAYIAEAKKHSFAISETEIAEVSICLLYTSPSPRDLSTSRMPSSA